MYYPYLRGKQFELLALREFSELYQAGDKKSIHPIIEPVKKITSTYEKTIKSLIDKNIPFTLILNPKVGELKQEYKYVVDKLFPLSYENFCMGIIITNKSDITKFSDYLNELNLSNTPVSLIVKRIEESQIEHLLKFIKKHPTTNIVVYPSIRNRRHILRKLRQTKIDLITFSDPYNKLSRNKDYAIISDEFFSEENLYYNAEGYSGYSDMLTIGEEYSEKGFTPYAVAIHLTYLNEEQSFRIHHFVSDSNDDIYDIGAKFIEALDKLIPFIRENEVNTNACNTFEKLYHEEKYPGLGTVKKLSILNHMELVKSLFE